MKKFAIALAITVSAVFCLVACKSGIEKDAKKQLKSTMLELSKNPDSFVISKLETKYCTDSLCILHSLVKGQNGFGGYSAQNIEYIYFISNDGTRYEYVKDIDENGSVLSSYHNLENLSKKDSSLLNATAALKCIFQGREISGR